MVLGFQGKAQVESLYGHVAEAMLSQPATKIFLKTSEPHAAEWISKAIGEVEVERFRESHTKGIFPGGRETEQRDNPIERLVMASEVAGLDPLHGYLKHGNLVVQMRFPYMELPNHAEKFIERKTVAALPVAAAAQLVPKPPQAVRKKQESKSAEISEQPYFE
jgi:type IV secretory pathway TraG/TraD family ATPase VirD4